MRKMYTFTLAHAGVNPRLRLALLLLPALLWLATPQTAQAACDPTVTVTSTVNSGARPSPACAPAAQSTLPPG